MRKHKSITVADAETAALGVLAFIAEDERRLARFLGATGIALDELRARAGDRSTLQAALGHLLEDESLLLVHAATAGLPPETFAEAAAVLAGDRAHGG